MTKKEMYKTLRELKAVVNDCNAKVRKIEKQGATVKKFNIAKDSILKTMDELVTKVRKYEVAIDAKVDEYTTIKNDGVFVEKGVSVTNGRVKTME